MKDVWCGNYRRVFLGKNYVYKVPRSFQGFLENLYEWRFWEKYKRSDCAPTVFSLFGLLNVQPRCEVLADRDPGVLEEDLLRLLFPGVEDLNEGNVGYLNGVLVVFDYPGRR